LNLEERRRENKTWIKIRVLGGLWSLSGWQNFKIIKISDNKEKISDPPDKRDISEISDSIGRDFFPWDGAGSTDMISKEQVSYGGTSVLVTCKYRDSVKLLRRRLSVKCWLGSTANLAKWQGTKQDANATGLDHSWLLYVERMRVNMSSFYFLKRPERK
jgi:hypothetical protein